MIDGLLEYSLSTLSHGCVSLLCRSLRPLTAALSTVLVLMVLPAARASSVATVALYTTAKRELPVAIQAAMQDELDRIVRPIGTKFSWRRYTDAAKYPAVPRLVVIQFKGRCDTEDLPVVNDHPWKLGWTHIVDGQIIPYVDVLCDAIRTYIAPMLLAIDRNQRDLKFGRALGRVIAHELHHVFAETRDHGTSGLAKEYSTREDLVSEQFRFASKELRDLRAILVKTMLFETYSRAELPLGETAFATNGCAGCHGPRGDGTPKGPSMHASPADVAALRARLSNRNSEMSRLARDLELSWQEIKKEELAELLTFLKSITTSGVSAKAPPKRSGALAR